MGRPADGYYLADGTRVPSVTTIIGKMKDADRLMYWAWQQGKEGKDFRETRDAAASAGTLAHAAVEAEIHGDHFTWPTKPAEVVKKAKQAFANFQEWAMQTQLKVTHTEVPLVSEKHRYGGTLDAMILGSKRTLGDWKTSGGVYSSFLVQLAGYKILWEEHHPEDPVQGFVLGRFDKEHGDFAQYYWSDLADAEEAFLHLRALYELDKKLAKRVK